MKISLCTFIGHKWVQKEKWVPSFWAEVITEYTFTNTCLRCGKKHVLHQVWNGSDFEVVDEA